MSVKYYDFKILKTLKIVNKQKHNNIINTDNILNFKFDTRSIYSTIKANNESIILKRMSAHYLFTLFGLCAKHQIYVQ